MSRSRGIWIVTDEATTSEPVEGEKSGQYTGPKIKSPRGKSQSGKNHTHISVSQLKNNMEEFLDVVEETFEKTDKPNSKMVLDELELVVEINGKGQVSLLGTGTEVGAKGGIKLKFKRKDG